VLPSAAVTVAREGVGLVGGLLDRRGPGERAGVEIAQCLLDLHAGVHDERPMARHGLAQQRPGDQQKAQALVALFRAHRVAVLQDDQARRSPTFVAGADDGAAGEYVGERRLVLRQQVLKDPSR
jgi:hypothetical protein